MKTIEIAGTETGFVEEKEFSLITLVGSLSDLSQLDFQPLGLNIVDIDSQDMDKFLKDTAYSDGWYDRNKSLFDEIKAKYAINDDDRIYVVIPIDFAQSISEMERSFFSCLRVLRIMFSSVITIYNKIRFQLFDDKYIHWTSFIDYHFVKQTKYEEFMSFEADKVSHINKFIDLFAKRSITLKYLSPTMDSYDASFQINSYAMQYISLCICLETVVNGKDELIYRIRRSLAILCGDNVESCNLIYNNVSKLYSLRSTMVHTGKYNYEKIEEYMPYIQALASKLIIELIIHNIDSHDELNLQITKIGFGDNGKVSKSYNPLHVNSHTDSLISSKELSKP